MATLTPFQQEKLKYFFKFFEPNENNQLDGNSLGHFMKRVQEFTGWDQQSQESLSLYQVHEAFFEILFDKTATEEGDTHNVTLDDWLSVWANLLPGCMGTMNFPVWLRLLPKTLFKVIDRNQDGVIGEDELYHFYRHMIKLSEEEAKANSHLAFAQMTDNGRYPLDENSYQQIFSNFLLGQTPHGPGRHIFGCFEHSVSKTPFCLIQPAPSADDDDVDIKVVLEKRPKRVM